MKNSEDIKITKTRRDKKLNGKTFKKQTPVGNAYITINCNGNKKNDPFEIFIKVGKPGSEVYAVGEAIGRLISLILRIPSKANRQIKLSWVIEELCEIDGGRSIGAGKEQVRSLPDGIAQVLVEYLDS